jgi:hypothetical protein
MRKKDRLKKEEAVTPNHGSKISAPLKNGYGAANAYSGLLPHGAEARITAHQGERT